MKAARGFTLIELLVALLVLALICSFAIPGYVAARASVESSQAKGALYEDLITGIRAASLDRQDAVLCASLDGASCSGSRAWETGWILFLDRNGDRQPDPGARLLRAQASFDARLRVRSSSGRTRIVMQPHGGAAAGSNVTFTICDARGAEHATTVVVANSGRIRNGRPTSTARVTCP